MDKKENKPKANKPIREDDQIETNDLPYDPNITKDDLQALDERSINRSPSEERFLAERDRPVDLTAEDLDIPGTDLADTTHEGTDIPDEENFQYDERGVENTGLDENDLPDPDSNLDSDTESETERR